MKQNYCISDLMSKNKNFLPFWTDILLVFFHFGIKGLGCAILNIVNINQINFRGWWPLRLNFGLYPGLRRWGFRRFIMLKRILTLNKSIKKFLQNYYIVSQFLYSLLAGKVQTFWEAHKNLLNLPHALYIYLVKLIHSEKATKFCEISTNYLTGITYK